MNKYRVNFSKAKLKLNKVYQDGDNFFIFTCIKPIF